MALWNLTDKTILIVDDFPEMRSLMRSMVIAFGARRIELASKGEEAINAMESGRFDIVLCDYNLGDGKDGQQVLEEAKHRDLLPGSTAFVMVTAESTSQMVLGALEYQPDGYIAKPVTKTVLQARLKKLLEKKASLSDVNSALDAKQYGKVIERCDRHIAGGSKYRLELLRIKSDALIKSGSYEQAITLCEAIIAERELSWAMFDLGRAHYHQQRYSEAADIISCVIESNSSFVSAYDWLAKIHEQLGDPVRAQSTLMAAVGKSPKSILRQRALADLADRNKDYEVTQKARRTVIRVGKGSVLRQPGDYTGLARALVKNGSAKDALKIVESIKYEFRGDSRAELEAAVATSNVFIALGQKEKSKEMLEKAIDLASTNHDLVSADVEIDLAEACLAHDRTDDAHHLIRNVVKNNHDNEEVLEKITRIYQDTGAQQEIEELIDKTRKEVVLINNKGVKLLKEGKIEESIELFSRAARGMPHNPIINLNAAQSLVRMMKESQPTKSMLDETFTYIRAVGNSDMHRDRLNRLVSACRELSACL